MRPGPGGVPPASLRADVPRPNGVALMARYCARSFSRDGSHSQRGRVRIIVAGEYGLVFHQWLAPAADRAHLGARSRELPAWSISLKSCAPFSIPRDRKTLSPVAVGDPPRGRSPEGLAAIKAGARQQKCGAPAAVISHGPAREPRGRPATAAVARRWEAPPCRDVCAREDRFGARSPPPSSKTDSSRHDRQAGPQNC
jgi:hypothetical protein